MKTNFNLKIWPQLIGEKWNCGDFNKVNCNKKNSEATTYVKWNEIIKLRKNNVIRRKHKKSK